MTGQVLPPLPTDLSVFRLQMRKVARTLRPELIGLGVVMAAVVFMGLSLVFLDDGVLDYPRELGFLVPLAAFAVPFRLWRGQRLFDRSELWTLPVERQKHALLRIAAGAVWMLLLIAGVVAVFNLLALISDGAAVGQGHRILLAPEVAPIIGPDAPWLWAAPFGSGLVSYLLASSLVVGLRHPLRWSAGLIAAGFLLAGISGEIGLRSAMSSMVHGALGTDRLATGGFSTFEGQVQAAGGAAAVLGSPPTALGWAVALVFWLGLGLAAVALATARHRER